MSIKLYSASAGSGKTHHLTYEYLKKVLIKPDSFQQILAVTFTNKATEEMKNRILKELWMLASGQSSKMLDNLLQDFSKWDETTLRLKAQETLSNILYNYHFFNISTIDSFFQQIMRIFTRELGVQIGYNINLDSEEVITEAINNMLEKAGNSPQLTNWVYDYIESKINDGKGWNFRRGILQLGKEIIKEKFSDYYSELKGLVTDNEKTKNYLQKLNSIITFFEEHQIKKAIQTIEIISLNNLSMDDFSFGKAGVAGWIYKLPDEADKKPENRVKEAVFLNKGWYSKNTDASIKNSIEQCLADGLEQLTKELYQFHQDNIIKYNTAKLIKNYFFVLGLSSSIMEELAWLRSEKNTLMLQDVNVLLSKLTADNDVPFIYERTGNWLKNLFIDEFQDTSLYQWSNILPLLKNNTASGFENIIVGDVKQSIYRWRGGDWSLMLNKIFDQFDNESITKFRLEFNYRSSQQIISFNNALFSTIPSSLTAKLSDETENSEESVENTVFSDTIIQAYHDSIQEIPKNQQYPDGFVYGRFIESDRQTKWSSIALDLLKEQIIELTSKGFLPQDITILVRRHEEGKLIADFLLQNFDFNIVSKEVLSFSSSSSVSFLICSLKYLNSPDDNLNIAELLFLENEIIDKNGLSKVTDNLNDVIFKGGKSAWLYLLDTLHQNYKAFSLYDLCEKMISQSAVNLIDNEKVYLQSFLDIVLRFNTENSQDLTSFIEYWNENSNKLSIALPELNDGIKIMTIHKSKGLQFKVVIIPFCDWKIDHNSSHENIIWCQPKLDPFNTFPIVPVRYGEKMKNSIFSQEYYEEKLYACMDNLNALYVAFTRAERGLIFFSPASANDKFDTSGKILNNLIKNNQLPDIPDTCYNETELSFRYGEIKSQDSAIGISPSITNEFISTSDIHKFKQTAFRANYDDDTEYAPLHYGKFMHYVLSKIQTVDDIETTLDELKWKGEIDESEFVSLKVKLNELINQPLIKDWFSDNYQVFNEHPLIIPDSGIRIPDKVLIKDNCAIVIDFKFSEPKPIYIRQISDYMSLLKKMNYSVTNGYLVFIDKNGQITLNQADISAK